MPAREYDKLTLFERRAVQGTRYRVPDGTHPVLADLADHSLMRVVDVLNEKVDPEHAKTVLQAATILRDEICGPVVRRVELKVGLAQLLADAAKDEILAEAEDVTPLLPDDAAEALGRDPGDRREKAPASTRLAGAGDNED